MLTITHFWSFAVGGFKSHVNVQGLAQIISLSSARRYSRYRAPDVAMILSMLAREMIVYLTSIASPCWLHLDLRYWGSQYKRCSQTV